MCQAESCRLQQALFINVYQGFVFAYESLLASQVRLLLACVDVIHCAVHRNEHTVSSGEILMVICWGGVFSLKTRTQWEE